MIYSYLFRHGKGFSRVPVTDFKEFKPLSTFAIRTGLNRAGNRSTFIVIWSPQNGSVSRLTAISKVYFIRKDQELTVKTEFSSGMTKETTLTIPSGAILEPRIGASEYLSASKEIIYSPEIFKFPTENGEHYITFEESSIGFLSSNVVTEWAEEASNMLDIDINRQNYYWIGMGSDPDSLMSIADCYVTVSNEIGTFYGTLELTDVYNEASFFDNPWTTLRAENLPTIPDDLEHQLGIKNGTVNYTRAYGEDSITVSYRIKCKSGNGASSCYGQGTINDIRVSYNVHNDLSVFTQPIIIGIRSQVKVYSIMFGAGRYVGSVIHTLGIGDKVGQKTNKTGAAPLWANSNQIVDDVISTIVSVNINGRHIGTFPASPNGSNISFVLPTDAYAGRNVQFDRSPYDLFRPISLFKDEE